MEHHTLIKCLKNELSMEEWRDTFELGDKYEVSNLGRVRNFESISEACEKSGINNIQACCNGGRVKSAGGFIWKYAED